MCYSNTASNFSVFLLFASQIFSVRYLTTNFKCSEYLKKYNKCLNLTFDCVWLSCRFLGALQFQQLLFWHRIQLCSPYSPSLDSRSLKRLAQLNFPRRKKHGGFVFRSWRLWCGHLLRPLF